MIKGSLWKIFLLLAGSAGASAQTLHPILPIGSPAPNFALPGVDGKIHRLSDYAASPVLAIVFTCNHCPISQMYEQRIQRLADDYRSKGVAVVAIQPNDPKAIRIDELDSSDMSDSLEEMKQRVQYKHLTYPYLYDGDTQQTARAYGPQATPHVFVFDEQRRLRYEGQFDDNYRIEKVKTQNARMAIDALLAHQPVAVTHTGVFGCSTKWSEKSADRIAALEKIDQQPVSVEMVSKAGLTGLRANPSRQLMLVDLGYLVRLLYRRVRRSRGHAADVPGSRLLAGHRLGEYARREERGDEVPRKEARHQQKPALRFGRYQGTSDGVRRQVGLGCAVYRFALGGR
jgi:thiol-disulfide isomerase/thioredoxin